MEKEGKISREIIREGRSNISHISLVHTEVHSEPKETAKIVHTEEKKTEKQRGKAKIVHTEVHSEPKETAKIVHTEVHSEPKYLNILDQDLTLILEEISLLNSYSAKQIQHKTKRQNRRNLSYTKNILQDFLLCLKELDQQ